MSSVQRVALYVFFDSIERDLVGRIRGIQCHPEANFLTPQERDKAIARLDRRSEFAIDKTDDNSLLTGLDLGEKYQVLMRMRGQLDHSSSEYYLSIRTSLDRAIPTRNAIMHGRPLTTTEFGLGFALANDFVRNPAYWPILAETYESYTRDPDTFLRNSITLLDEEPVSETLHNLPAPDYDDTGFLPRPDLEKDLRKKILGRYPVITVLGEGGNGKTALALQTLYGLVESNDHDFDAIIWTSAKSTRLGIKEIERIEGAITDSLGLLSDIADQFEPGDDTPLERVQRLLSENKILLVIDNLETVLDEDLRSFAAEIPGESKLVFTSRVPLGADLSVLVGDFSDTESRQYLRRLIEAYQIKSLKTKTNDQIDTYARKLNRKPLLLKWFALGVSSGLDPDRITNNADVALKFCMENVIGRLSEQGKAIASALAILPTAASAPMLKEVTGLSAIDTEAGIAELLRYALIQRDERHTAERQYQIGFTTKSYISRVLTRDEEFSNDVLRKYRSAASAFQMERGARPLDKFDGRFYVIRNKSEALTARRLKQVFHSMNRDDFTAADAIIAEVRVLSPEYFEVYRVEAFLAVKTGDISRAAACYETALELAQSQPQLHTFYAAFLARNLDDYDSALKQIEIAMRLAPNTFAVMIEAVRLSFYTYKFDRARELLGEISKMKLQGKDAAIRADLGSQLFIREADYSYRIGDLTKTHKALLELLGWLRKLSPALCDQKHREHLRRAPRLIYELGRNPGFADQALLEILLATLRAIDLGVFQQPTPSRALSS